MFNRKVKKKIAEKVEPVVEQAQDLSASPDLDDDPGEGYEYVEEEVEGESEQEEQPTRKLPRMPKPQSPPRTQPLSQTEIFDVIETNLARCLEVLRYARTVR